MTRQRGGSARAQGAPGPDGPAADARKDPRLASIEELKDHVVQAAFHRTCEFLVRAFPRFCSGSESSASLIFLRPRQGPIPQ